MATVTITFDTDNAAFEDAYFSEIDAVLRRAMLIIERNSGRDCENVLLDSYGNTIGSVEVTS